MAFDHILLIGFGGPTRPEEVRPFIENVTRGIPIPEERLKEVEQHYQAVGGVSPYNEWAQRLSEKIREKLLEQGIKLPVFLGMRNWNPFLKETIASIKQKGLKQGIGVILAPHRSEASYDKYLRAVEEAKQATHAGEIVYEYLPPWFDHPGFIQAQADAMTGAKNAPVIFTAHSIPLEMAQKSHYVEEVTRSSELVAQKLGITKWRIAWQSRSGPSTRSGQAQPWVEPDVISVIKEYKDKGEKAVMLVPIGFLCDNVEILYDLDIESKETAKKIGIGYQRASTVNDCPQFVAMFAELIQEML